MPACRKYTALLLLILFGYILTPAALIHAFHGHEDTHCLPGLLHFDEQHVHCKTLQIEAQVYTPPVLLNPGQVPAIHAPFVITSHAKESCAVVLFADPRAPPAG